MFDDEVELMEARSPVMIHAAFDVADVFESSHEKTLPALPIEAVQHC